MPDTVLLHACCATCSGYPLKLLSSEDFKVVVFYSNSNIYPYDEYEKRLEELISYTKKCGIELIIDNYQPEDWENYIKGLENEPEKGLRCRKCFDFRLSATARKAVELGIDKFTTTLTVSPHKRTQTVFEAADEAALKYGVNFLKYDFKKQNGFFKTMTVAKEENFYRQNYCGCLYSIRKQLV